MKKLILLSAVFVATFMGLNANAQVSVNINIGAQPVWGPVGYDYVDYYYLPDVDAYYAVNTRQYTYFNRGRWVTSRYLPPAYRNYDLYNGYKVVINEPSPWLRHDRYRTQYVQYRGRHGQPFIRDSRDERYYVNPHHPQHAHWKSGPRPGSPANRPQQVMPPRGNHPQHANPGNGPRRSNGPGGHGPRGNGPRGNAPRGNDNHGGNDNRGGDHGNGQGNGNGHGRK